VTIDDRPRRRQHRSGAVTPPDEPAPMPGRRMRAVRLYLAASAVAIVGACSDGGGPSLSVEQMRDAGGRCPVDLEAAVAASRLDSPGGDLTVEVSEGSGEVPQDASVGDWTEQGHSAVDWYDAVVVTCIQAVDGGDVTVELMAVRRPQAGTAVGLVLPQVARDLALTADELEGLIARFEAADAGDLVDLGGEAPIAVAPLDVDGAESAVLYVSAAEVDAATPADVRAIAEDLLGRAAT
jgi:hypothetical protein